MSGLGAYTPDPPFFTTDINNEFLSRFKNPQVRAQVQVPAIEEYEVLTLFEFLEKLDNRTTSSTRSISKDQHYQSIKVKNRSKMKEFLSQYLCKGKIGRSYGITAVERALDYDDYDVLIVANGDILEDVVGDSDSQVSVTSNMDSQNPEDRLADLADELTHPVKYGDWLPQSADPVGVVGPDGDMRYNTGDSDDSQEQEDSNNPDDSQAPGDSREPGNYIDLDFEDEEDEDVKEYDDWKRQLADDVVKTDEPKEKRADAAYRPDPKGKTNSEKISYLKKQKDDSDAIREKKLRSVVGFLIVQKGECRSFPEDYAVNLICVRDGVAEGVGPILIGLYLYTILERFQTIRHLQLGLLELAGGYYNISGLCLYSKFGFVPSMNLAIPGCFPSPGNMPMELHFPSKYRARTIDDAKTIICSIVAGSRFHPGFKLPVCNIPRGLKQFVLIALREYYRLLEYVTSIPKRIDTRTFMYYCSGKPELDLINSLLKTAFRSKVIAFCRNLMIDIELDVNLDANDNEFIRIISSVRPNTPTDLPQRDIGRCYRTGLIDYRILFNGMFPKEAAAQAAADTAARQPGGGQNKKTAKRAKRNKKTIKRNKKAAKRSKRKN